MYEYQATLVRVIDGDTVVLNVDLGFHIKICIHASLKELNTYELRDRDKKKKYYAHLEKNYLITLLDSGSLRIITNKTGKYGRWLVDIVCGKSDVNELMRKFHFVNEQCLKRNDNIPQVN